MWGGRAYQQEQDPKLWEFLTSSIGTNPELQIRLLDGESEHARLRELGRVRSGADRRRLRRGGCHPLRRRPLSATRAGRPDNRGSHRTIAPSPTAASPLAPRPKNADPSWQDVPLHNTRRFATQINDSDAEAIPSASRPCRHIWRHWWSTVIAPIAGHGRAGLIRFLMGVFPTNPRLGRRSRDRCRPFGCSPESTTRHRPHR